ncbi:MAG TPA: hypothetical protein VKU01_23260 [Bryobacteraceae bacterium]|nr:hypothetical protein [Bryobacteraceae bacterium]
MVEAQRVRAALETRLREEGISIPLEWQHVLVDPYRPKSVREAVSQVIQTDRHWQNDRNYTFHLHHTGGTSIMGVHALEAIEEARGSVPSRFKREITYLSGRENVLRDSAETIFAGGFDERRDWQMDIRKLAGLHGYKLNRVHQPSANLISVGCDMVALLKNQQSNRRYAEWLRTLPKKLDRLVGDSSEPRSLTWAGIPSGDTTWDEISSRIGEVFQNDLRFKPGWLDKSPGGWVIDRSALDANQLQRFRKFIHYECLELLAFDELRRALNEVKPPRRTDVHHSVELRRGQQRQCEIDVLAVCGYDLLAVSCSMSAGDKPKEKGFEIMYRARQIGGTNARGIVVCAEDPRSARAIQDELEDDIGGRGQGRSVTIWGRDVIDDPDLLRERFRNYLADDMKWGSLP